jgi:hypothetical protein
MSSKETNLLKDLGEKMPNLELRIEELFKCASI